MKHIAAFLFATTLFSTTTLVSALAHGASCAKAAEQLAIEDARKEDKSMTSAKNTQQVTDAKILAAYGVKPDEESYSTEVHGAKGAFAPYDVTVKKKGCKKVSAKATEL